MPQERKRACPAHSSADAARVLIPGRTRSDAEKTYPMRPFAPGPFRFSMRRVRIDWRTLHGIDVDRLVCCVPVSSLAAVAWA